MTSLTTLRALRVLCTALVAGVLLAQTVSADDLMPDKEIHESRATIEESDVPYVDGPDAIEADGEGILSIDDDELDRDGRWCLPPEEEPKLVDRCYDYELEFPDTYEEFEATVKGWIATCVMSRTIVNGKPIRRERELVEKNPTLRDLWDRAKDEEGSTYVFANYCFQGRKAVSIEFF